MVDRTSHTNITRQNDTVIFTNEQTQRFEEEDFVEVYNDNAQNYKNLLNQLEQFENKREEILEENEEELARLHYVLGIEGPEVDEANLEGGISEDTLQMKNELDQLKENIENLEGQKERLEEQLTEMREVAQEISDDVDEIPLK